MKALQIAATGMSAQQMRVEVVSNNLANMSTTGYNARRAEFADLTLSADGPARHRHGRRMARCCRPGSRSASACGRRRFR